MENQIKNLIELKDLFANTDLETQLGNLEILTKNDFKTFMKIVIRVIKNLSKMDFFKEK
ncbi:hypothetical protein [Candidatus Lokiarchaeum ossiferum]|uniref:hypothetical protein n=1 Tax=Candidatus Lokiarchaeum ossiferum TaxID=2951803 RepID=UPI00352F29E6